MHHRKMVSFSTSPI